MTGLSPTAFSGTLIVLMKPISDKGQLRTNTDEESCTSWFRRIFGKAPTAAEVSSASPVSAPPPPKPARNQKVLVVDDDPLFLKLAGAQLENEGFSVLTAKDGCEAIEVARKHKPNLMLLDVNLPQDFAGVSWNGYRVISWMQRFESLRNIPVVMTSGGDPAKTTRAALNSGATAFFHKRMNQSHLVTLVNHTLMRRPGPSPKTEDPNFEI